MTKNGNILKVYHHSGGKTGVHMTPHKPITYDVSIELFFYAFVQKQGYEVLETTRQIKERKLGKYDDAYEVTKFENGHVVGME